MKLLLIALASGMAGSSPDSNLYIQNLTPSDGTPIPATIINECKPSGCEIWSKGNWVIQTDKGKFLAHGFIAESEASE